MSINNTVNDYKLSAVCIDLNVNKHPESVKGAKILKRSLNHLDNVDRKLF